MKNEKKNNYLYIGIAVAVVIVLAIVFISNSNTRKIPYNNAWKILSEVGPTNVEF